MKIKTPLLNIIPVFVSDGVYWLVRVPGQSFVGLLLVFLIHSVDYRGISSVWVRVRVRDKVKNRALSP